MSRGRRPIPDAIKFLKGNPGHRKLELKKLTGEADAEEPAPIAPVPLRAEPPDWLTDPRERAAFAYVIETMPATLVKNSDVGGIARYAHWMRVFIETKLEIDENGTSFYKSESKNGGMLRPHPLLRRLSDAETKLVQLEDRLLLNPKTRRAVIEAILENPTPPPPRSPEPAGDDADDESPLGYLTRHETKHH